MSEITSPGKSSGQSGAEGLSGGPGDAFEYEIDGDELLATMGYGFESPENPLPSPFSAAAPEESIELTQSPSHSDQLAALAEENNLLRLTIEHLRKECEAIRGRYERDRETIRYQLQCQLMKQVLPLMDNFDRAMEHATFGELTEDFVTGVVLLYKQLADLLEQNQVVPILATGEIFNPEFHEAVLVEAVSGVAASTILTEFEKGYTIGSRLLRPARVKVAVSA